VDSGGAIFCNALTLSMTIADLDRLTQPPCMDVCPVCGSDQVHGQHALRLDCSGQLHALGTGESAGQRLRSQMPRFSKHVASHRTITSGTAQAVIVMRPFAVLVTHVSQSPLIIAFCVLEAGLGDGAIPSQAPNEIDLFSCLHKLVL
jgi:hypothetical protein